MMNALLVALGGGLGSLCRHWASALTPDTVHFPYATLGINLFGSFLIGLLTGIFEQFPMAGRLPYKELLVVGFLGGFTTFSAFSLQTLNLLEGHRYWMACTNIIASVLGGLFACWLGFRLGGLSIKVS